jgi:hypothetical protein
VDGQDGEEVRISCVIRVVLLSVAAAASLLLLLALCGGGGVAEDEEARAEACRRRLWRGDSPPACLLGDGGIVIVGLLISFDKTNETVVMCVDV